MKKNILKVSKAILCILLVIMIPFSLPLITRLFIHMHLYKDISEFNEYISIFFNKHFLIILAISLISVYFILCNKDRLIEWLEKRDFSLKTKDVELSSKMTEMVEETTRKKNFITNMNSKEDDNKIVAIGVQEELELTNSSKEKKHVVAKWTYKDENKFLEDENNKLRFFSAYNIINQKTKELLNIIYCNKSMELDEFKNQIIRSFKSRNRKNKNLTYEQKNEYANNKYETIKEGLQFLNIIEISDDNKIITLTSYGKTFVEEYIEKEVGEDEN